MNEKGDAVNVVLLSLGVGVILEPDLSLRTLATVAMVTPPIVLGALFPDLDTTFGTNRKTFHNVSVLAIAVALPPCSATSGSSGSGSGPTTCSICSGT